jgi:hypothetical protein
VTLIEIVGEKASVAVDFATVHVGAAMLAARRAGAARSERVRVREWERAALQLRRAQGALAEAEIAMRARAREAAVRGAARRR